MKFEMLFVAEEVFVGSLNDTDSDIDIPLPKGKLPLIFFGRSLREPEVERTESGSLLDDRLNRARFDGEGGGLGIGA